MFWNKSENENDAPKKDKIVSQEDIMKILDSCYEKCLNGIPKVSKSVEELADDYLSKNHSAEEACKEMINNQIIKCTTSGFLTNFGGLITIPVSLPANITSVLYVQMRMIACTAYIGGMELDNDKTQTFVYACLAGVALSEVIKQFTVKFGIKFSLAMVKKIPGKVLTKINQKVGFRLLTKFGTKGLINIGKCVPVVGAVVGGGMDLVETKIIADRAYKWFIDGDFSVDESTKENKTIDSDEIIILSEDFDE